MKKNKNLTIQSIDKDHAKKKNKAVIKILKGQNTRIYKNKRTCECPKIFKKMVILIGYHKNTN